MSDHLELFARLRGVSSSEGQLQIVVEAILKKLHLESHKHKLAKELSGKSEEEMTCLFSVISVPFVLVLLCCYEFIVI